jgi:hypothetical protein
MTVSRATITAEWLPTPVAPATGVRVHHDRAILRFATLQSFSLIYLQKVALLSTSFPLSVPMLTMFGGVAWMVVIKDMTVTAPRLGAYLLFVGFLLIAYAFSGGSVPSLMQLILLYATMTVCGTVSEASYRKILGRFTGLMILPACIVIEQYLYQTLSGRTDPLDLESFLPNSLLLQGFNYSGHVPWNSPFIRPNGFFFLEPSFASACTAAAAIMEITYFRRAHLVVLFVAATLLTMGGTGISMLAIATPLLLVRESPRVIVAATVGVVAILSGAYMLDARLPLVSRANELESHNSSAGERLLMPAMRLADRVFDPSYVFAGSGAGQVRPSGVKEPKNQKELQAAYSARIAVMNPWPIVKLVDEYGLLSMVSFILLYVSGVGGNFNVPLKMALSIIYMFTGGYLLSPIMAVLVMLLCFTFEPDRSRAEGIT